MEDQETEAVAEVVTSAPEAEPEPTRATPEPPPPAPAKDTGEMRRRVGETSEKLRALEGEIATIRDRVDDLESRLDGVFRRQGVRGW